MTFWSAVCVALGGASVGLSAVALHHLGGLPWLQAAAAMTPVAGWAALRSSWLRAV